MRRRARLGRYFTFARQSPVTFLSGTKDAFSNGDRHRATSPLLLFGPFVRQQTFGNRAVYVLPLPVLTRAAAYRQPWTCGL